MEVTRGDEVGRTFLELGDVLGDDAVGDFLHWLVERCVAILGAAGGGVLLEAEGGKRLALATATSEETAALERWQLEHDEGPGWDAYRGVAPVIVEDLRADHRWPLVGPKAADIGMLAVYAFPLRVRDDCIGALNLHQRRPAPLSQEDMRYAQAFANIAAVRILRQRKITEAEKRADQLQHALYSRVVIEQAKGIIAERYGVSLGDAFESLRDYARSHRMKISKVSQAVIEGLHVGQQS